MEVANSQALIVAGQSLAFKRSVQVQRKYWAASGKVHQTSDARLLSPDACKDLPKDRNVTGSDGEYLSPSRMTRVPSPVRYQHRATNAARFPNWSPSVATIPLSAHTTIKGYAVVQRV
jgi:hypothetical protein